MTQKIVGYLLYFLLCLSCADAATVLPTWAGYLYQPGVPILSVSAIWRTPQIVGHSGTIDSFDIWPGIYGGGNGLGTSNQDLIQTGCAQSIFPPALNNTQAECWYTYCNPPMGIQCIANNYSVDLSVPGDIMIGSIFCTGGCTTPGPQTWTMAVSDCGQWGTFVPPCAIGLGSNLWNHSITGISFASTLLQAIWIVENPGSANTPLPNYGTAPFYSVMANGVPVNLNGPDITVLQMSGNGGTTSNPSSPTSDGSAFNLCWGISGYTSCPAPLSPTTIAPASGAQFGGF